MKNFTFLLKTLLLPAIFFAGSVNVWADYSGTGTFTKITSVADLTDGYYVILNEADAFVMTNGRSGTAAAGYFVSASITPASGVITNPSVSNVWKIETNGSGRTIYNEAIQKYVGWSSGNSASIEDSPANSNRWTFTYVDNKFTVKNVATSDRQLSYNSGSPRFAAYANANQQELQLYKLEVSTSNVATPTFSPEGGAYTTTQSVELSTTTAGAEIYYTTNGEVPTAASTKYENAISVSTTTTIKAIAVLEDESSAVATAIYSFPVQVANIAAFLATSESGEVIISGAVTVVYQNNVNLYVQDNSGSLLVYGDVGKTFTNGNQLTGLKGKLGAYGQSPQMADPVAPDATNGTAVDPAIFDLSTISTSDLAKYVKVKSVQFSSNVTYSTTSIVNGTLTAPSGFVVRDNFKLGGSYVKNKDYDIIGFISYYNGTAQLFPVTIEEVANTDPSITVDQSSLDFSDVDINTTSTAQDIIVTVANLTEAVTYEVTGSDKDDFSVSGTITEATGGTLNVTFSPTSAGTKTATLTISSGATVSATVNLSGTGVVPPLPTPTATAATAITTSGFTANWEVVTGATEYVLDVYTGEEYFSESFETQDGTGGNDGSWNGSIASNAIIGLSDWTLANAFGAKESIKLGASSKQGSATTPALGLTGNATLTFRAGAWKGDQTELLLEIEGGGSLSETSVTMFNESFTSYTISITNAVAETKITFKGKQVSSSRFFLDDVKVSSLNPVTGSPFTVTGASKEITGLTQNTTYYYTVKAKAGASESVASNEIEVTTLEDTGTATNNPSSEYKVFVRDAKVIVVSDRVENVEIYNSVGQCTYKGITSEGETAIAVNSGVNLVKLGNSVHKLIVK